jgi:hypothetical protein
VSSVPVTFELPHPSAHRLIRNADADARKDLPLPMQGQMIGDFADDDLRQ